MVHRDPSTGKFVSGQDTEYSDIEVVTFSGSVGVQASNLGGTATFQGGDQKTFEGLELLDYDEFVDRNEELVLLSADHSMSVFANSTESEDGTVRASVEVSASPAITNENVIFTNSIDDGQAVGGAQSDDSIDLLGRQLVATAHAPFSDTSTGVGGGGSAGEDRLKIDQAPAEFGRFHPRDELFMNGTFEAWNIDDSGVHVDLTGQHVYGVLES